MIWTSRLCLGVPHTSGDFPLRRARRGEQPLVSSVLGKKGNRVGRRFILSLLFLLRFAWGGGREGRREYREYSLYSCMPVCGSQKTTSGSQCSSSLMWNLGIELRSSVLAASAITHRGIFLAHLLSTLVWAKTAKSINT